jgi:hypothetical protein
MSPARTTSNGDPPALDRLVRSILLDCILLAWVSEHGHAVAVASAIATARRDATNFVEYRVLEFLQALVAGTQ